MSNVFEKESSARDSLLQKRLGMGAGLVIAVGFIIWLFPRQESSARISTSMQVMTLPPILSLPPPPPPPTPEEKLEDKMAEKVPVMDAPPSPDDDAMKATDGAGDSFGLKGSKNGRGFGTGGSRWGFYAGQVQAAIQDALRENPRTRHAGLRLEVRIWPDPSGTITRVELAGSTGDPSLDTAIKTQVLGSLRLQPPPEDMPRPIILRITGRAPS
ncbi:MAG: TonB C-terminal domain-containing protein [Verrucomicrobiia bacterium]